VTRVDLAGQTVIVVGLGKSGVAASRLLLGRGARVVGLDEHLEGPAPLAHPDFSFRPGPLPERLGEGAALVVVSPGVPLSRPELQAARAAGVPVWGEIELAWQTLPPGAGPILAITGTNGKSTTTALLGALARERFARVFVGGNLGTAFTLAYADPATPPYDLHVIELSSFQLEGVVEARFDGAAILNLTPDHLDRYPDLAAYGAAKARILERQPPDGFTVVNGEDPKVLRLAARSLAPVYAFCRDAQRTDPGLAGRAMGSKERFGFTFDGLPAFTLTNRALRGAHNLDNAMAAALLASLAGVPADAIQRGLDAFPGLPHRLEWVRTLGGVEYLNDSKATNVDSSVVALQALPAGVWLIAGGKGKGAPYAPLVEAARGRLRGVLTIGQDAPALEAAFRGACPVEACGTLEVAVASAHRQAAPGDTVLLSPACASYDQFQHFEHRGDVFKALVRALPETP
jgi:UDP-N-acetylmuramoylalanine--D-glutamate ligase